VVGVGRLDGAVQPPLVGEVVAQHRQHIFQVWGSILRNSFVRSLMTKL
jgi:hypothetical protein